MDARRHIAVTEWYAGTPIRAGWPHSIRTLQFDGQIAAKETPMRKLWSALFVTAALRGDANSAFGANFNAAYFPKLGFVPIARDRPNWRKASR